MEPKNKVAVITGAGGGIGREIARTFVHQGAKVVITDINAARAKRAAADLSGNDHTIGLGMDVSDEQQVGIGMETTVRMFGGIDILVSNAGIQTVAPLDQFEWKQLLSIHLDGAFLATRAAQRQKANPGTGYGDGLL
jgi:3-hydroxybutyrate dehydrogenase